MARFDWETALRKRRTRIVGYLLWGMFAIGAGLVVYHYMDLNAQMSKQHKLLADWSTEVRQWGGYEARPADASADAGSSKPAATVPLPEWQDVDGQAMLGSVVIPSIDLEEPIVRGADDKTLLLGAGAVVENRLPGQDGTNFVLASHRSRTFGRHFNRLDELKPGDAVEVETTAGTFRYVVTETSLVLPDDLSVLENAGEASTLTLITCHPIRNPTHRLIVKAELQPAAALSNS
ncbi:class D sortase [Cohnella sp. GCM10027633]|uniref:class D sortase n=1 Tax=unclassified Cohnella TaxID=2636738 RepID=UPI003642FAEF